MTSLWGYFLLFGFIVISFFEFSFGFYGGKDSIMDYGILLFVSTIFIPLLFGFIVISVFEFSLSYGGKDSIMNYGILLFVSTIFIPFLFGFIVISFFNSFWVLWR
jgi:hypothetical protein